MQHAGYAPKYAKRFDGAGSLGHTHIFCLPSKGGEYAGDSLLSGLVIATDEHSGCPAGKLRFVHGGVANAVEGLDQFGIGEQPLDLFHQICGKLLLAIRRGKFLRKIFQLGLSK